MRSSRQHSAGELGQKGRIQGDIAEVRETMTETEKLLLDALQSLETNRKQTEKLMLSALEKLQQKVTSLEQENERLTRQQQQLSEAWQAFGARS